MIESDAFSTHIPILMSAIIQSDPKSVVVEFGMGHYSTPMLHELCADRMLVSIDNGKEWMTNFEYLRRPNHAMMYVEDPNDWTPADDVLDTLLMPSDAPPLGVIFIDNGGDVSNRVKSIKRWGHMAEFVVIHDCNVAAYGLDEIIPDFKYCYEYKPYVIHTLVLSNTAPFETMADHEGLIR